MEKPIPLELKFFFHFRLIYDHFVFWQKKYLSIYLYMTNFTKICILRKVNFFPNSFLMSTYWPKTFLDHISIREQRKTIFAFFSNTLEANFKNFHLHKASESEAQLPNESDFSRNKYQEIMDE